jgi:threonine/homoserine/homoserine lactone efflux protein
MGAVIGDLLPLALGVAISPVPIIAVILMLLSAHPTGTSVAFLVGWVLGIAVVLTLVTLVVGPATDSAGASPSVVSSVLKLILGAAAVLLAVRQWRSRPRGDEPTAMPKWMAAIDHVAVGRAFGLGALLSGVNPKNLTLCITAGVTIGSAELPGKSQLLAGAAFVLIGSCSVALPVLAYLVARDRAQQPLNELRTWLTTNNTAVMSVLLLVMGVSILGKGLAGL